MPGKRSEHILHPQALHTATSVARQPHEPHMLSPLVEHRSPAAGTPAHTLQLQRTIGNQATMHAIRRNTRKSDDELVREIGQAIDGLNTQTRTRDKESSEERGTERATLIEQIGSLRQQIASISDNSRKADLYLRLNQAVPYYYQVANANIAKRNGNVAGMRTCNITTLAMNLEGFGRTPADFTGDTTLLANIATQFDDELLNSESATANPREMRLPDFLQLVVVYVALTTDGKIKGSGGKKGLGKTPADMNALATANPRAFAQLALQARDIGANLVTIRGTFDHFTQFFNVESNPIETGWGRLSEADYKARFIEAMEEAIGSGKMVVAAQQNPKHFVRIDSVSEEGVLINDPGRRTLHNKLLTWSDARKRGLLYGGYITMTDEGQPENSNTTAQPASAGQTSTSRQAATPRGDGGIFSTFFPETAALGRQATSVLSNIGGQMLEGMAGGQNTQQNNANANNRAPWIKSGFYEKAQRVNEKYAAKPPKAGWPYLPEWRAMWAAGNHAEFADEVARYQFFGVPAPVNQVDGILGGNTVNAIKRTHPQVLPKEDTTSKNNNSKADDGGVDTRKLADAAQKILMVVFGGDQKKAPATNAAATAPNTAAKPQKIDKKIVERINDPDVSAIIDRVAAELGMDANTVRGIIAAESGGKSQSGAGTDGYKGLMQAEQSVDQLDPETSIRSGITKYMRFEEQARQMMRKFGVNAEMTDSEAISITMVLYNAGPGSVKTALKFAQEDGDARRWFDDPFFVRSLLYHGAYAISTMKSKFRALGGDALAAELATVTGVTVDSLRATYQKNGQWQTEKLVEAFRKALLAEWKVTRDNKTDRSIEEWEKVANGWLLQAARFKHGNLQKWYVQRVLTYKDHYDLQSAVQQPELSDTPKEND
jgi:hypothetical protein